MTDVDMSSFADDTITLTFSVPEHGIDAYTLADALTAFANLARAVDQHLNPGQEIAIEVVALTPGSVRAHLRRLARGPAGFFSDGAKQVFWGVVGGVLTFWILGGNPEINITVDGDRVVVTSGDQTVVVTKDVFEAAKAIAVQENVAARGREFFEVLEADPMIDAISVGPNDKKDQRLRIGRGDFGRLIRQTKLEPIQPSRRRRERARLVVTKPSLHIKPRKWAFEWNGVPLSAPISDVAFRETLVRRGFLFGYGDVLEVEISYTQVFDVDVGDYMNDTSSYEISKVFRHIPSA